MNKHLRPEARPADWKTLDQVQQDAFSRAASIISEAIEGLPTRPISSHYGSNEPHSIADPERASRILFISGARGTGKTTVLVTLIQASLDGKLEGLNLEDIDKCIKKMNEHAIWLEPLDMEPLPKNSNLLGSIMARIEAAIRYDSLKSIGSSIERDAEYRPRQLFEPSSDYHDSMIQLQRLQTDIAIAWDGNIQAREGHLDPDAFALEMMRSEQSRLHINKKFHAVLDLLSYKALKRRNEKGSIFILPVDDIDLNPSSCLKIMNLFRMVSVPRLFTIVLGDLDLAELVLNFKFSSDLAKVAEGAESIHQVTIKRAAANISSNSLRKLVPSNQRINLAPMNTVESLIFRPLGSPPSEFTIYELLDKFHLSLKREFEENEHYEGEEEKHDQSIEKIKSMGDFLLFKGFSVLEENEEGSKNEEYEIEKNNEEGTSKTGESEQKPDLEKIIKTKADQACYNALDFLNSTPREIADIWFGLKKVVDNIELKNNNHDAKAQIVTYPDEHFHRLLENQIKTKLFEEMAYENREKIRQSIGRTSKGEWEMGRLPLNIAVESEHVQTVSQKRQIIRIGSGENHQKKSEYEPKIELYFPKGWRFEREHSINNIDDIERSKSGIEAEANPKIPVGTASTIMLLHDLLTMCDGNEGFRSILFKPSEMKFNWVVTEWHLGEYLKAALAWPSPPCKSFWEYDVFIQPWTKVSKKIAQSPPTSGDSPPFNIESIFFAWLSAGTTLVDRKPPVTISSLYEADWPNLIARLEKLTDNYNLSSYKLDTLDWLINIAMLIMPETGLPENCYRELAESDKLRVFWNNQKLLIAQRRAQRLALILQEGMIDLTRKLIIKTPSWFDTAIKPDELMIYRYAGIELAEEEKEKKRSYDIAAIVEERLEKRLYKIDELSSNMSSIHRDITKMKKEIATLKTPKEKEVKPIYQAKTSVRKAELTKKKAAKAKSGTSKGGTRRTKASKAKPKK